MSRLFHLSSKESQKLAQREIETLRKLVRSDVQLLAATTGAKWNHNLIRFSAGTTIAADDTKTNDAPIPEASSLRHFDDLFLLKGTAVENRDVKQLLVSSVHKPSVKHPLFPQGLTATSLAFSVKCGVNRKALLTTMRNRG